MSAPAPASNAVRAVSPATRMAIDYSPLLVFFAVNFLAPLDAIGRAVAGTAAFMVATGVAMVASKLTSGRVSPMLLITGALVLVFGGLTVWFRDPSFIKMKPTFVYAIFAGVLGFGLATGRPLLQQLLEGAYPGLDAVGWRRLTRNWTGFFVVMAALNELVWRNGSTDFWVGFKLWGAIPLTLLFAGANVPMLLRHGLMLEDAAVSDKPPEG